MAINVIFLISITVVVVSASCQWPCKWTIDGHTLDLTPFQEMGIEAVFGGYSGWTYSPCNNLAYFQSCCMIYDWSENVCAAQIYGNSSYNVAPTLYINSTDNNDVLIIWEFIYDTYQATLYDCTVTVLWICNNTISGAPYVEIKYAETLVPSCLYELKIYSFVACLNNNILPPDSDKDQCFYVDYYTKPLVLNLTELHGTTLFYEGTDNNGKSVLWYYSICQNNVNCSMVVGMSETVFINQLYYRFKNSNDNNERVTAAFNKTNHDQVWTVYGYYSGYLFYWICGESEYKVLNVSTLSNDNKAYEIMWYIESKYACVNQSELECVFKYGLNTLNLTAFIDTTIYGVDSNNEYSYLYAPCRNPLKCYIPGRSNYVMAYQYDINNERNGQCLAIWYGNDQDLDVFFYGNNKWQISFKSGQICDNNQTFTNFTVYWSCNKDAGFWNVDTVREINICNFEMYIESAYIC